MYGLGAGIRTDTSERTFQMRRPMRLLTIGCFRFPPRLIVGVTGFFLVGPAMADSPWETAVTNLQISFTGPIARGLSLVAIVVGGLMFAFGEGDSKRMLAGILFGIGMAIGAVNFMSWLFP